MARARRWVGVLRVVEMRWISEVGVRWGRDLGVVEWWRSEGWVVVGGRRWRGMWWWLVRGFERWVEGLV